MAKIKAILPSLREKKRYLAFEILSKGKIKAFSNVSQAVWNGMLSFNGQVGTAQAGILVLPDKYNLETQRGIIRVNHKNLNNLKAALTLVKEIEEQPVVLKSIKASGMINKVERYIAG